MVKNLFRADVHEQILIFTDNDKINNTLNSVYDTKELANF